MEPSGRRESTPSEGRLLLSVQRVRLQAAQARQLAEICAEEDRPLPTAPRATLAGDPARLRGLPAVGGRGLMGSALRGSLPHVDGVNAADRALALSLATLVRDDVNGASPGSDPLEALLAKEAEAETIRRLAGRLPADSAF